MTLTTQKISDSYWKVIINNPPINLFNPEMSNELIQLMDEMEATETLKVVVFESANPEYFIAHADLLQAKDFQLGLGKTGLSKSWQDIAKRFEQAPFASIAKIRGRARAMGSEFSLAMDMQFASKETALFSQFEIGVGAFPGAGGMERLPLRTGRSRALEIILSGDDFDAETAASYGWINRAIPDNELDAFVDNLAKRIESFDKPVISEIKSLINARVVLPKNEDLLNTEAKFLEFFSKQEAIGRVTSLFEKGFQQNGEFELNLGKNI